MHKYEDPRGTSEEDEPNIDSIILKGDMLDMLDLQDDHDAQLLKDDAMEADDEVAEDDETEKDDDSIDNETSGKNPYLIPGASPPITLEIRTMVRDRRRAIRLGTLSDDILQLQEEVDKTRPKTRAECVNGPRPCIYFSCKHNLMIDVNQKVGSLKINFPDVIINDFDFKHIPATCALDVAAEDGLTLEDVGDLMNLTRQRIQQLETEALQKSHAASYGLHEDDYFTGENADSSRKATGNRRNGKQQNATSTVNQPAETKPPQSQDDTDLDFSLDGTFDL